MGFPVRWDRSRIATEEEMSRLRESFNVTVLSNGGLLITPKENPQAQAQERSMMAEQKAKRPEWMPTNPYLKRLQRKYEEFIGNRTDLMDFEQWLDTQNTQGMAGFDWGSFETARKLMEEIENHMVRTVGYRIVKSDWWQQLRKEVGLDG